MICTISSMAKLRECHLEKAAVELANDAGWENLKMDKAARSWPDQIFFGPGKTHFIVEFKRPGETPRPQQVNRHETLGALGHHVYVVDTLEQFRIIFARYVTLASQRVSSAG